MRTPDDAREPRIPEACRTVDESLCLFPTAFRDTPRTRARVGDPVSAAIASARSHLAGCTRCQLQLSLFQSITGSLQTLPTATSPARSWAGIRAVIAAEELATTAQRGWASGYFGLAAAALLVASALLRSSSTFADWLVASGASGVAGVAREWLTSAALRPWLAPTLFVGFGSLVALAAFPILRAAGRAARTPSPLLIPVT